MKRAILLIIAIYLYATPHAQVTADSLQQAVIEINPDSSAIGKPVGDSVKKTIGPEGGTIHSADGMMELIFPPGGLTAPTGIGIQRVERTSVMSFGNAYSCTPDGLHFEKPVQLVMHYTDSMAKGTQRRIMTIQWQDKTGRWSTIEDVKVDTVARSITCDIGHFSTYAGADKFKVVPDYARIKVKKDLPLAVIISGTYPDGKKYKSGAAADAQFWPGHPVEWSVAGIAGGNDVVGHIRSFSADNMNKAIYTAPVTVPADGITITAKYIGTVAMGKDSFMQDPVSVAVVDIYDEYHYSFIGYDHVGHMFMIDSATCDIQVYSSGGVRLYNIRNPTPWSDWPAKVGKCSYDYPDKTGWKGMVQLTGMNSGVFQRIPGGTSYHPTATTKVLINLTSTMGSSPTYKEHCPGIDRTVPSFPVPAQPVVIHFEIFPDKPDILITYGGDNGMNSLVRMRGNQGFSIAVSHK